MMGRCAVAAAIMLLAQVAPSPLHADDYSADGHIFNVISIPEDELEQRLLTAILVTRADLLGPDMHPVTQTWPNPPCIQVVEGESSDEATVMEVANAFRSRAGIRLGMCSFGDVADISYFFASQPSDPSQQLAVARLFDGGPSASKELSRFINGESDCYWRYRSSSDGKLNLVRAMIAANTSALDASQLERCIFMATSIALGVSNPFILLTDPNLTNATEAEWRQEKVAILFAAYILHSIGDADRRGNREQLSAAVQRLLHRMHREGNTSQKD